MMGRTHIAVGFAAGLALASPHTLSGILLSALGGAAGAVLCDIEMREKATRQDDRLLTRGLLVLLILLVLILDSALSLGIGEMLLTQRDADAALGLLILTLTAVKGRFSPHRGFTHSLLYTFLITFGGWCISRETGLGMLGGALSHLLLDLTNKKPLQLLWPLKKGFCLKWFLANRLANRIFLFLGLAADVLALSWYLGPILHVL